jgi:hypothetical protein
VRTHPHTTTPTHPQGVWRACGVVVGCGATVGWWSKRTHDVDTPPERRTPPLVMCVSWQRKHKTQNERMNTRGARPVRLINALQKIVELQKGCSSYMINVSMTRYYKLVLACNHNTYQRTIIKLTSAAKHTSSERAQCSLVQVCQVWHSSRLISLISLTREPLTVGNISIFAPAHTDQPHRHLCV